MTIPTSALRTFETIPESISESIGTSSVNGLLATELALDMLNTNSPWPAVLPTEKDFKERTPLMWPPELQMLLPPTSLILLNKQKTKLALDWNAASSAFPHLSYDHYVYNWFLVSTRTFYYTSSNPDTKNPPDTNDCLALVPFADYFNHADVGCEVIFSPSEYVFHADRQYERGEEIFMSYGNHNNDFLLVEYGFTLDENRWDEVYLDEVILLLLSKEQKKTLDDAGFLGCYVLDKEMICHRTRVALSLLCMPLRIWRQLLAGDIDDEDQYKTEVAQITLKALHALLNTVDEKLQQISLLGYCRLVQADILRKRWEQIRLLLRTAVAKLEALEA
jgi:SET domain